MELMILVKINEARALKGKVVSVKLDRVLLLAIIAQSSLLLLQDLLIMTSKYLFVIT
jgi:hypothetical protein